MEIRLFIAGALFLAAPLNTVAAQNLSSLPNAAVANSLGNIDTTRQAIVSGTVKYARQVGDRYRIQLLLTGLDGQVREWSLEGPKQSGKARFHKYETAIARRRARAGWPGHPRPW